MLTTEEIKGYMRGVIAQSRLSGDIVGLRDVQRAAGLLMRAATVAGDEATARAFRLLAAEAANDQEAMQEDDDDVKGRNA